MNKNFEVPRAPEIILGTTSSTIRRSSVDDEPFSKKASIRYTWSCGKYVQVHSELQMVTYQWRIRETGQTVLYCTTAPHANYVPPLNQNI